MEVPNEKRIVTKCNTSPPAGDEPEVEVFFRFKGTKRAFRFVLSAAEMYRWLQFRLVPSARASLEEVKEWHFERSLEAHNFVRKDSAAALGVTARCLRDWRHRRGKM